MQMAGTSPLEGPAALQRWPQEWQTAGRSLLQWWQQNYTRWPDIVLEIQAWGALWRPARTAITEHLAPVVELRRLQDGRWVALCLKFSRAVHTRNVFSYGGRFIDLEHHPDQLREVIDFLAVRFAPGRRPPSIRKTLRIDVRELHEQSQQEYGL